MFRLQRVFSLPPPLPLAALVTICPFLYCCTAIDAGQAYNQAALYFFGPTTALNPKPYEKYTLPRVEPQPVRPSRNKAFANQLPSHLPAEVKLAVRLLCRGREGLCSAAFMLKVWLWADVCAYTSCWAKSPSCRRRTRSLAVVALLVPSPEG